MKQMAGVSGHIFKVELHFTSHSIGVHGVRLDLYMYQKHFLCEKYALYKFDSKIDCFRLSENIDIYY